MLDVAQIYKMQWMLLEEDGKFDPQFLGKDIQQMPGTLMTIGLVITLVWLWSISTGS